MTTWSELPATSRTIWNPVQQDSATFLATRAETGGRYSLIDIECAPGGGNALHVHKTFAETFEVTEGELTLRVGREERVLRRGERATVPPGTPHCFANRAARPARFLVRFDPGHEGMESGLRIIYGLARDGGTTARGIPRKLSHLAVLGALTDTFVAGPASVVNPLLRFVAARARRAGVEAELTRRYCPPMDPAATPALAAAG